jgi:hypothetical protein
VAIDPHRGYLAGLVKRLPDAVVTIDCFHGVKLANTMVDDVRRRVQNETLGHRGHKDDPLYRSRRLMTRGFERLSDRQLAKLFRAIDEGDPDGEVGAAILAKELMREMYSAKDHRLARWKLVELYQRRHRRGRGARDHPLRQDRLVLGGRDPQLPRDRDLQRSHRSPEPDHREDPKDRSRLPELRELSAAALAPLRR